MSKLTTVAVCPWAVVGNAVAEEILSDGFESGNDMDWSNLVSACVVPTDGGLEDVSSPTTVVGNGTPASRTSDSFVHAVAQGGVITFDCGPDPVTMTLDEAAKVFNNTGPEIVIDRSVITANIGGSRYPTYPQISNHPDTPINVIASIIR